MNGYFGKPPLKAPITREAAESALRQLVSEASLQPHGKQLAAICGRDVMSYLDQLEAMAHMADERTAEINRKLDEILRRLPPPPAAIPPGGGSEAE